MSIRRIHDTEEFANNLDEEREVTAEAASDNSLDGTFSDSEQISENDAQPQSRYRRIVMDEEDSLDISYVENEQNLSVIPDVEEVDRDEGSFEAYLEVLEEEGVAEHVSVIEDQEDETSNDEVEIHEEMEGIEDNQDNKQSSTNAESSASKENEPVVDSKVTNEEEESFTTCSICLEPWSNLGEHRIVSLKCGHLFGKSCIEQWLRGSKASSKCPQCNAKASVRDLRIIYAKCVKVEDRAERQRLMEEISRLKKQNQEFEKERAMQKMKSQQDNKFIQELQQQLRMLKESTNEMGASVSGSTIGFTKKYKLGLFQTIDMSSRNGCCRVMAFNQWMNMLVLSTPSQVEMFPGFGIKKINTLDFKVENFYHLHSKQIRDLAFNPDKEDLLLSVSFDQVAKVTNVASNATVVSYSLGSPLWSCCWSKCNSGCFYVGTSSGQIHHFDTINNTENPMRTYNVKGSGPIVSMYYVQANADKGFYCSGLLVTRLNSITFEELTTSGNITHDFFIEGTFTHTAFDPVSLHMLVTSRPTDRNHHVSHKIYSLKTTYNENEHRNVVVVHEIHSFQGSTTMKVIERNCLTTINEDKTLLAIFNEESTNSVKVCDVSTSSPIQTVKPGANIIDILPFKGPDGEYVAMLSEKSLKTYKWINRL
ncbi:E3 ubiquitin-protein ligase RFWD3 [Armadillidium nasatum]|uniref:RING-type E3 ubiquitin transferase n=1 Tax=Armadillidium nasatum TaxID=96803 RepID=A0A5N5T205_9CRUS|nr:E3 ubiquitin-protein ligase RFWD3 [Armadillidium nasatum]